MVILDYKKLPEETKDEYIFRVCKDKELIGSWQDVADILNEELGTLFTESKFRKWYKKHKNQYGNQPKDVYSEIDEQRRWLEKEKIKFRDERNEYNKLIRQEARKESYIDLVKNLLSTV